MIEKPKSILIDTNVFIALEDNKKVEPHVSELSELCSKHGIKICLHESTIADIKRDSDSGRKEISLSKIDKFDQIEKSPTSQKKKEALFGEIKSENDCVDTDLLLTLHQNIVSALVTEDKGIHKRVNGNTIVGPKVYNVSDFVKTLKEQLEPENVDYPHIQDQKCNQLDIEDPFFNSLKSDYDPGFTTWFSKRVSERRDCWVIQGKEGLGGLCIYKEETIKDNALELQTLEVPGEKVLKLCLFKVAMEGGKFGEQMLKKAMDYAFSNQYDSLYLTTFPKQKGLITTIERFGFVKGGKKGEEDAYYKECFPPKSSTETGLIFHKKFWPHIKITSDTLIFWIPIQPEYHKRLFPEIAEQFSFNIIESSHVPGNALRKVYICRSNTRTVPAGSILLFYRSHDLQQITSIGICEEYREFSTLPSIQKFIGNRSVYSSDEVQKMLKPAAKALNFYYARNLKDPIHLNEIIKLGIVKKSPQSITQIKSEDFLNLLKQHMENERKIFIYE